MIGQTLAHYEILEPLGEGGMGVVYKARDTRLDRLVAIKVLPADRVADDKSKRRFMQEAKAASALNHPNIVTIYGIDHARDVDFIAMEYMAGRPLSQVIPLEGLPLRAVLRYAIQIADALVAAHAAGIVHRDLKPGNVMVTESGAVKVLDFGLAKLVEPVSLDGSEGGSTMIGSSWDPHGNWRAPPADGDRRDHGHAGLHVARAGRGKARRQPLRHLQFRRNALRDGDGA